MKLKRIASAVLAAVMAVTSTVVCEVTAGAADSVLLNTDTAITATNSADFYTTIGDLSQYDKISIKYTYSNADGVAAANADKQWAFAMTFAIKTQELVNYEGNYTAINVGVDGYSQTISNGDTFTAEIDTANVIAHVRNISGWNSTNDTDTQFKWFITTGDGASTVGTGHTIKEVRLTGGAGAPYEGTKLAIPKNEPWNYQGTEVLTLPSTVSISSAKDIIDNYGNVTVTVPLNGAVSGSDTNFDLTKLSFQLTPRTYKDSSWPWVVAGTTTYNAATKTVTITADLATALNGEASIAAAPEDYTFSSLQLIAMCELTNASAPIDLYHGTPTVSFSPATVPVSSVTITNKPANTTVKVNDTITLEAKVNDDATVSDKTVAWRSLDSSVADYADNSGAGKLSGEFKFLKAGTVTIEAVYGPDNSIKDTVTFTVLEADVKVNKVTITKPTTTEYIVGSDVTLEAKVNDDANVADKTIKWSSSDANIASVDETTGKVTFKKAGEVTITAFYGSDSTIKDTITLVVSEPANDDYVESPVHYDETTADAAKPINITLNGSGTNSVLYVMSVSEQDAKTFSGVKVKVLNDDGTVIKEITLNTVYQAFKFVGADNVKYIESGVAGRYFAIVRIDNVNAVGSFTVSMELVK